MNTNSKTYEFIVSKEDQIRLDRFLVFAFKNIGISIARSRIEKLIDDKCVSVLNGKIAKSNLVCKEGWKISVNLSESFNDKHALLNENIVAQDLPFQIIFEDNDILVVNKTANFVVHPGAGNKSGTLLNAVKFYLTKDSSSTIKTLPARLGLVHRLDKDTTGLILFAKSAKALTDLGEQFSSRSIKKEYICLVHLPKRGNQLLREKDSGLIESTIGRDPKNRLKMATNVGSRIALTKWQVLERLSQAALVSVNLLTGRTHQIRVHMCSVGSAVLGDTLYGDLANKLDIKLKKIIQNAGHQLLHAWKLEFKHPVTGKKINLEAPLPLEFLDVLEQLRNV